MGLLKVPFPITAVSFDKNPVTGEITQVYAKYEKPAEGDAPKKPKRYDLTSTFLSDIKT